jgi:sterol desaturase/sphingolipid hydroxylase (fatty acid hydroxylase superfamily)
LLVLGVIFGTIERRWPITPQRFFRPGWQTDAVHFVVDQVASGLLLGALVIWLIPILEPLAPNLDSLLSGPARFVAAAIIGELAGYWGHRTMHRVPWLWKLHEVHHSSPTMDWLAPNRRHVLDTTLGQAFSVLPLFALGLRPPEVVSWFVLSRAQGLFVHANIRCHLPVIRWIFATPEFHHWHHSSDPAVYNKNFAGQSPIIDWMFGTLHMPKHSWPTAYGLGAASLAMPTGYLDQLWWPMHGVELAAAPRRLATVTMAVAASAGGIAIVGAVEPVLHTTAHACQVPGLGSVDIGGDGIIITTPGVAPDRTTVRDVNGSSYRVVRRSGAPLTLSLDRNDIIAVGPEGARSGSCTGS